MNPTPEDDARWAKAIGVNVRPDRHFCPYCAEEVQLVGPDFIEQCSDHGVLEGISDKEWETILQERGW